MGQPYYFRDQGGIGMEFKLETENCINKLDSENSVDKLSYVKDALLLLRKQIGDSKAMLGFCGSPWTLACYMIDGGSSPGFPRTVNWAKTSPNSFGKLMEKISSVLVDYLNMQVSSGVDAIQIFDSWNALCPDKYLNEWSLDWINQISVEVSNKVRLFSMRRHQVIDYVCFQIVKFQGLAWTIKQSFQMQEKYFHLALHYKEI